MEEKETENLITEAGKELEIEIESEIPNGENTKNKMPKSISPGRQVLLRFFRSKLSIIGLIVIIFLFLFSFIGPLLSPWDEIDPDDSGGIAYSEIPITVTDEDGTTHTAYLVTITETRLNIKAYPSSKHWLGTDENGRDVLTRLMYGGRISLLIGFIVIFAETFVGVILGGIAGYFGKWIDQIIMRLVDIFSCIPMLPILLIASVAISSLGVPDDKKIYVLMIMLTTFGWSSTARLVRGQILQLKGQEMMIAAESLGFSAPRKIAKHLIPNVMPQLIVSMTSGLGGIILYEASLSWLGLGVPYPLATWGSMIKSATDNPDILANFFHIWLPAGICIVMAVLAFNFIGDGLRDAFDPKGKR